MLDMPEGLLPLQQLLQRSLARVERVFDRHLRSDLPPVNRLCEHIERYRGKMLRPMLVVLSGVAAAPVLARSEAGCGSGDGAIFDDGLVSDSHIAVAAVCEMIHMATLVHDDVLDEADTRRRGATVNRLNGNEAAVILGDYLFSAAYYLCSSVPGDTGREASLLIGQTGMTLCAGELLQLDRRGDYSLSEEVYFEIVERKTASLIATACRLGASLSEGASGAMAPRLHAVGLRLGVAFQIQDDLLDLTGVQEVVGKSVGRDVVLGKLTLPIIHHLAQATPVQRGRSLAVLRQSGDFDRPPSGMLREAIESTGSLAYSRAVATRLVDESKVILGELPDTAARAYLLMMADAVVNRTF